MKLFRNKHDATRERVSEVSSRPKPLPAWPEGDGPARVGSGFTGTVTTDNWVKTSPKTEPVDPPGLPIRLVHRDAVEQAYAGHNDCHIYMLDITCDKHARAALRAYAESCQEENPQLASRIRGIVANL